MSNFTQIEDCADKITRHFEELGHERAQLVAFASNAEVARLLEAAQEELEQCFVEELVMVDLELIRDYFDPRAFYVRMAVRVSYNEHLEHCGETSFLSPETLRTTWDMEEAGLVSVSIDSTLPPEVINTLIDLGKLQTRVTEAHTYKTILCES